PSARRRGGARRPHVPRQAGAQLPALRGPVAPHALRLRHAGPVPAGGRPVLQRAVVCHQAGAVARRGHDDRGPARRDGDPRYAALTGASAPGSTPGCRSGSVSVITVPPSGGHAAVNAPRCSSAVRNATDSPNPPPRALVVKNGSKICSRTSAGIPGPVSRTSITAVA